MAQDKNWWTFSNSFNQLSDYVIVSTNCFGDTRLYGGQANPEESQPIIKNTNQVKILEFKPKEIHFWDLENGTVSEGTYGSHEHIKLLHPIHVANFKNTNSVTVSAPFIWTQDTLEKELDKGASVIIKKYRNMNFRFLRTPEKHKPFPSLGNGDFHVGTNEDGSNIIEAMFGTEILSSYPKPTKLIENLIQAKSFFDNSLTVLDYFAGSGTTGHATINLNREDGGRRQYILVEMGSYFDTVTKPRILKAAYSKDWRDGKPVSREGVSQLVKYISLEQYEDTLNNLELTRSDIQSAQLKENQAFNEQYRLSYMLDMETKGSQSLLNIDNFATPFDYQLCITRNDETQRITIDLIETFNYLLGLTVHTIRRDKSGIVIVTGHNNTQEHCLVIWRDIHAIDNDQLDQWFDDHRAAMVTEMDKVYINGDNNIENRKQQQDHWTSYLIEAEFKRLMFEGNDG